MDVTLEDRIGARGERDSFAMRIKALPEYLESMISGWACLSPRNLHRSQYFSDTVPNQYEERYLQLELLPDPTLQFDNSISQGDLGTVVQLLLRYSSISEGCSNIA